jgi:hypothetical protein
MMAYGATSARCNANALLIPPPVGVTVRRTTSNGLYAARRAMVGRIDSEELDSDRIAPPPRSRLQPLIGLSLLLLLAIALQPDTARGYHTGTYAVWSPGAGSFGVTSPPRYHNGCEPYTSSYFDSPNFDNPAVCGPAATAIGNSGSTQGGHWSMDVAIFAGQPVYVDVDPFAVDGFPAGGTYRVVSGGIYTWSGSGNNQYQVFGIHVYNSFLQVWENYGWVVLGHINPLYGSGVVLCGPTTSRCTTYVGTVATAGTWPAHVHMEVANNVAGTGYVARSYNWDGPSNANDLVWGPLCSRTSSNASQATTCNTHLLGSDRVGYVGGTRTTFAQLTNPYYPDF